MYKIGEIALLEVTSLQSVGAFLYTGEDKELFLPFSEQTAELRPGDEVLVFVYLDNNNRPCSSMRLERFLKGPVSELKPEQKVNLIVFQETDLGYKAAIDQKYLGMLYKNETFQKLNYGEPITGYIKKIREDGKIDLQLVPFGSKGAGDLGEKILALLKEKGGFLPLTEKTPPETIYDLFGVSKKKYKMALGGIYKKKLIKIDDDGIRLV